jgi:hypothetical protein
LNHRGASFGASPLWNLEYLERVSDSVHQRHLKSLIQILKMVRGRRCGKGAMSLRCI